LASSLGWRDEGTQLWAFRQALADGEADTAALRADALLRTGHPPASFVRVVRAAATQREFAEAIAGRLRLNPDWRTTYFTLPNDPSPVELVGLVATIEQQARGNEPPMRSDGASLITHLIKAKAYGDAIRVDQLLVGQRSSTANLIDDGGFDRLSDDYSRNSTPFDWKVGPTGSIETAPPTKLIAESTGKKSDVAARYLHVPAGSYQLSYRASAEVPNAFRVRVACVNGSSTLAEDQPDESREMSERSMRLAVPSECSLIRLTIEGLPGSTSSTSEFDDFRLIPN